MRTPTACSYVGACGGCTVANPFDPGELYAKRQLLNHALQDAGFPDPNIAPLITIPMGSRRRMDFAAARVGGAIHFGLHAPRSHVVVNIRACPLADPRIESLIGPLRALFGQLNGMRRKGRVLVTITETGIDVCLGLDDEATTEDRIRLVDFAQSYDLARVSLVDDPILIRRAPTHRSGSLSIRVPPGAFLQPSEEGEKAILTSIIRFLPRGLPRRARVAELYAGVGSFTGVLAQYAKIQTFEGSKAATAALEHAVRDAGLAGMVTSEVRDLTRRPVMADELSSFAAVILDPPFGGAGAQITQIAASGVGRVIYVSCNPKTLARDARALRRSGYVLIEAVPIDQFPGSEHLEAVVSFDKN